MDIEDRKPDVRTCLKMETSDATFFRMKSQFHLELPEGSAWNGPHVHDGTCISLTAPAWSPLDGVSHARAHTHTHTHTQGFLPFSGSTEQGERSSSEQNLRPSASLEHQENLPRRHNF